MSASRNCRPWNSRDRLTELLTLCGVATPRGPAPPAPARWRRRRCRDGRSPGQTRRSPCPRPRRRCAGRPARRASSKISWVVVEAVMPIFFSGAPKVHPRRARRAHGTPTSPASGPAPVRANSSQKSACGPWLIHAFVPVDDVVDRRRARRLRRDRRDVRSGLRLGQRVGAELFAAEHARQPGARCSSVPKRASADDGQRVHRDVDADAHPDDRDLLEHLEVDLVRLSATAVLLVERQRQQPGLAEQREHVARELGVGLGLDRPAARAARSRSRGPASIRS